MSRSMDESLDLLGHVAEGAQTLTELAAASGLPKSTAHRLTTVLVGHGFLRVAGTRYHLGYRLMELGELVGTDIIYLAKIESARGLQMRSRIGLASLAALAQEVVACATAISRELGGGERRMRAVEDTPRASVCRWDPRRRHGRCPGEAITGL